MELRSHCLYDCDWWWYCCCSYRLLLSTKCSPLGFAASNQNTLSQQTQHWFWWIWWIQQYCTPTWDFFGSNLKKISYPKKRNISDFYIFFFSCTAFFEKKFRIYWLLSQWNFFKCLCIAVIQCLFENELHLKNSIRFRRIIFLFLNKIMSSVNKNIFCI